MKNNKENKFVPIFSLFSIIEFKFKSSWTLLYTELINYLDKLQKTYYRK